MGESRGVQCRPEAIARPGEMMTYRRRVEPGIDPAKKHP